MIGRTIQLFDLIERAHARSLPESLRSRMAPTTFADLVRRLDPHSLLLEYWVGPTRLVALWVAGGKSGIVIRDLAPADLAAIRHFATALPASHDASWRTQAAQIGSLLLAGIPTTPAISNLLIVPDGILKQLPFEALTTAPGKPLLLEQFSVSYLPSAALLPPSAAQAPAPAAPWQRQVVAFGDPVAPTAGVFPEDRVWARLPQSTRRLHHLRRPCAAAPRSMPGLEILSRCSVAAAWTERPSCISAPMPSPTRGHLPNRSRILFTAGTRQRGLGISCS